ncbi:AAA family ATPase [Thermoleptolyngbya sp.]
MTTPLLETRQAELEQCVAALLGRQSLLVLGEPGAGKTTLGQAVAARLEAEGYTVAIASYGGSAKETLTTIANGLGVNTMTKGDRPKPLTAQQLRDALLTRLKQPQTVLIADDAQRWSASLRYWLEDIQRAGGLLLLLAYAPQPKDIFVKLPSLSLRPLSDEEVRSVMRDEAIAHAAHLDSRDMAELAQKTGNNPALARRIVRETVLGISDLETAEHYQYVDGTPFFATAIALISMVRFIGLGMGDRVVYVLGGMLTLLGLTLRAILYAANRGRRRL